MYPKCPELTVIPAHLWGRLPYAFALVLSIDILTNAYILLPLDIDRQKNQ